MTTSPSWAAVRSSVRSWSSHPATLEGLRNVGLICIWYLLSTILGIYNKTLLGREHGLLGKGAFPAPLFMSSIQFTLQFLLAKLVFFCRLIERSKHDSLDWPAYWKIVVPNGVMTGMDIGFSNKSLVYITMSFYTMCKSTVPIFLLLCAFIWRIERPNWELGGVVAVICSGLILLVKGEAHFDLLGFMLVMSASAMSGVRFTLTQVSLHGHGDAVAMGGPLEVLELLTPIMAVTTLVLSLSWERLWDVLPSSPYLDTMTQVLATVGIIGAGAVLAFLMVWTEYKVIKETSALTFMIAGTCKEVITVIAAVIVFQDKFGVINGVGLVVVILGVVLFNVHKWRKMQDEVSLQQDKLDGGEEDHELVPLVMASGAQQPSAAGLSHAPAAANGGYSDKDGPLLSGMSMGLNGNGLTSPLLSSGPGVSSGGAGAGEQIQVLVSKPRSSKGMASPTSTRTNGSRHKDGTSD